MSSSLWGTWQTPVSTGTGSGSDSEDDSDDDSEDRSEEGSSDGSDIDSSDMDGSGPGSQMPQSSDHAPSTNSAPSWYPPHTSFPQFPTTYPVTSYLGTTFFP